MKTRILTVVAAMTLLAVTPGCGVLRQFWFGRGARCGSNAGLRGPLARLHDRKKQSYASIPTAPVCQQPVAVAPALAPQGDCGCPTTGPVYGSPTYMGEQACGIESYGGVVNDPYLNGGIVNGGVVDGGVINGGIVGEYPIGSPYPSSGWQPAPLNSQGYRTQRVDTDGAKILSEEPLPPGAVPLN